NLLELALRASSSYFSGYFFEKNADRNRKVTICMKKGLFCNSPFSLHCTKLKFVHDILLFISGHASLSSVF
ncbi:MAG: hypothetical protein WBI17_08145, partial [Clostridiaceae bacterium]